MDADALSYEVEALEHTYASRVTVVSETPLRLAIVITPHTSEDESRQYVRATLQLGLPPAYPQAPPSIALVDIKGALAVNQRNAKLYETQ
jgi:hypothetical protein